MKLINRWAVITLTLMTTIFTGCSLSDNYDGPETPADPGALELTPVELELVDHSNDFAFNLFKQIIDSRSADESKKNKSLIVSPISITYALGMLNNGAAAETQKQINKVLGFGDAGADGINNFCRKMLNRAPQLDSLTKVMIANNIYMNKRYVLNSEFTKIANTYYNAYPETRDFHDGQTLDVINKWASDHTEEMIKEIMDESSYDPDAVSYLLNAIYFKGEWATKFDRERTQDEEFYHAGDTKDLIKRPMMHLGEELEYDEIDGYQVVRLPYGNKTFQMTILLPIVGENNVNALPAVPSAKTWSKICRNKWHSYTVQLALPRIDTFTDIELPEIMAALGMPDAFNPDKADFSNFCDKETYIGMMKQVAAINLDEEGTEASAVTVIGMINTAYAPDPQIICFYANHPFIYIISEKSSNAIFFIGQYTGY